MKERDHATSGHLSFHLLSSIRSSSLSHPYVPPSSRLDSTTPYQLVLLLLTMAYYDDRQTPTYEENPYYYSDPRSRAPTDLVRRRDGSSESLDDLPRHYPPAIMGVRRSHSLNGRRGGYYEDSEYLYRPHHERRSRHEGDRHDRHKYSRSPSSSRSPHRRRRKSFSEQALGALGLGAAASSTSRHRDHSRGRSHGHHGRPHSYSPSRSRSRDRHRRDKSEQRMAQAARAALTAAAVEAFRVRKEPGEWTGDKGKRVLTAAVTAAGTDGLVDRDPNKHSKRHIIESTLAGLAANHFVNGPRSKSRSKSRGRGSDSKLKNLAATGALAAVGKEAYERFKSRSRSRHRGRSSSRDSYDDSDSPRRHRSHKRSKSVSDYINQGMEALGLGDKDKDDRRGRHRGRPSRYDDYSDSDRDSEPGTRRARHSRDVGRPRSVYATQPPSSAMTTTSGARGPHTDDGGYHHSTSDSESSSDLGDSSDEKKQRKKLNRQALMTAGLATIATVHAAHGLHQNMEKRKQRMKMVKEGAMSPEEARRRRIKANLADAASIGLSALGIKGAIAEWKEADEKRRERADFKKKCDEHRQKRHQRMRSKSQSAAGPPPPSWRTVYPDEIEENASSSGYLRSHAGQVRSPSVGADVRYRSSYWS
ncbi:uncharacterized protein P174DRAFT_460425 [Aspergillus novofumigatus IBT 16806]|uniref:DUF3824 domain-containing protein n=1 Tax=Aspergillus novofumigatus (strain IBT 16806) TaxID=1392255 RepID=A0A2I1C9M9_ASPN1|nr:uncharacterized protein P174DRAFT_460425 [Aspergillus novofumigatus IBT 16806]PKX94348.1 hypothetical protein P174DRAFT_460425 [Aspergillus novofumigatus IBT 16806]